MERVAQLPTRKELAHRPLYIMVESAGLATRVLVAREADEYLTRDAALVALLALENAEKGFQPGFLYDGRSTG